MSLEAQFYEARRRQNFIERRQSFHTLNDLAKQEQKSDYGSLHIPVRLIRAYEKDERYACVPMHRTKLNTSDQSIYQRNRDIYPRRPPPLTNRIKRAVQHAKLRHRFSSIEYLQQW
ncbi:unnamed protein product [Rotaria magnacalcarata]|uniref:Uncharacterized protein n=1 Tax=Rotaria magnacalcarata TaxID=392030 RepID=A0A816MAV5_9BILA|nr:unnamed protein product [Rotaria magnacalcarata]CAF1312390.1 unnamed protein product [Rotaria magnacalcarata]CAF1917991.1 unnamed protein product [Rotaria magnacalcarata]CAF1986690.1 unnamed protein product [Rotaria magnacalcarata]CAF4386384.1 unnamed protein product [Rotaria magnacalcarata]